VTLRDVIIIGAGPAGLSAARALSRLGVEDILVLEREGEAGGVPRHCGHTGFGIGEFRRPMTGPAYARRLVAASGGVELRCRVAVTRLGQGGVLTIASPNGEETLTGRHVLLATGARETPRSARLIGGTRPWGVTTTGALQQMVYLEGMRPFRRAVIVGTELVSFSALLTLRDAGIAVSAMIEEADRITARRPGDLIARWLFGVPVLTSATSIVIEGNDLTTGVAFEHAGERRTISCDCVVFSGRFVPEAALLRNSHLALDPGTGGPVVDQHWRCSDPTYFCAGNLLRGIETAGRCYREGAAAAASIAAARGGRLPPPGRLVTVATRGPLRYVYPQIVASPGEPLSDLMLKARVSRAARGRLRLVVNGREVWSCAIHALPERRIGLPARLVPVDDLDTLAVEMAETQERGL